VRLVKFGFISTLAALLSCATWFGQSADRAARQTFHIQGTIRTYADSIIPGAEVSFEGDKVSKTVFADDTGVYKADLPVGLYTVTAKPRKPDRATSPYSVASQTGLQEYQRPLFRVTSPTSFTLNMTLDPADPICDPIVPRSGSVPSGNGGEIICGGGDFFPVPSQDNVPFQLFIRYRTRRNTERGYTYNTGKSASAFETQVFVAYNLFTLRADHVVYDVQGKTLQATGNVVAVNADGAAQSADSMTFKIEDGQATPLH
jgi:hypothetical protein